MNKLGWSLVTLVFILMLVVTACNGGESQTSTSAAPSSITATPTSSFIQVSAPRIPHNGSKNTCFSCHQTGKSGPEIPDDHVSYQDTLQSCQKCHPGS